MAASSELGVLANLQLLHKPQISAKPNTILHMELESSDLIHIVVLYSNTHSKYSYNDAAYYQSK